MADFPWRGYTCLKPMFFVITITIFVLDVWWWIRADRLARSLPRRRLWRGLLAAFMGLMTAYALCIILAVWILRVSQAWIPTAVTASTYIWHLLILPLVAMAFILGGLIRSMVRPKSANPAADPASPATAPTRRALLAAAALVAPPLATMALTGVSMSQLGDFRIRRMRLPLPGLPSALDGFTIALVADIHTGFFTNQRMLNDVARRTNDLRADLILLLGDLVNLSLSDLPAGMDMVNKLDAPYGVHMIEGNHDIIQSEARFVSYCASRGMPVMLEGSVLLPRGAPLQLLSVPYFRYESDLAAAVGRIATRRVAGAFPILLSHHPHAWDYARPLNLPLVLSGHTHGGQIMLTDHLGAGPIRFRYWTGLYQRDNSNLIVSNGVGNWFPLRINAPAEIIHLTLLKGVGLT